MLCSPAWATWTLSQVKDCTFNTGSSCAVTVTSTGAGHLLVAGIIDGNTANTISSVTSAACSGTWTHAPNSAASGAGDGSSDLFYCTNAAAAQTSITVTTTNAASGGTTIIAVIWEASSSLGNIAIDSGATPSQHTTDATCTSCAGVSLTLSGNNDFIAGLAPCGGSCTGVTGTGWTNDLTNPGGDGVAHGITSGSQASPATWTQTPSATLVCSAAAFQETSGGGSTCKPTLASLGAGCG